MSSPTYEEFLLHEHSHRRHNPLTDEWVLVSPHRSKRPWLGQAEQPALISSLAYDPTCYLCPGNKRVNGVDNDAYTSTFVFTNDFAAVESTQRKNHTSAHELLKAKPVSGTSRVICFSPDHSKTLPQLSLPEIEAVIRCWADQVDELSRDYTWVQVFENKGAVMGCSNPHPHGQIWATDQLPTIAHKVNENLKKYFEKNKSNLLLDYVQLELEQKERLVDVNDHWVALVPYWATWPFEILLLPLQPVAHLNYLTAEQQKSLADILKNMLIRYDNLFQCSFPYSMGWHGRDFSRDPNLKNTNADHWQLHAHFYPPLLRSATVKKFMVGYEMLAEAQRDITPEQAADRLRQTSTTHYSKQ